MNVVSCFFETRLRYLVWLHCRQWLMQPPLADAAHPWLVHAQPVTDPRMPCAGTPHMGQDLTFVCSCRPCEGVLMLHCAGS